MSKKLKKRNKDMKKTEILDLDDDVEVLTISDVVGKKKKENKNAVEDISEDEFDEEIDVDLKKVDVDDDVEYDDNDEDFEDTLEDDEIDVNDPVSMGEFVGSIFLCYIPIINLISLIVWSVSKNAKPSKKNWARAQLIWVSVGYFLILLVIAFFMGMMMQ